MSGEGTELHPLAQIFYSGSGASGNRPAAAGLRNGSLWYSTDTLDIDQVVAGAWVTIFDASTVSAAHAATHENGGADEIDATGLVGVPVVILKTATEIVNNSIVLQNDDELFFPVAANEVWEFTISLLIDEAAGSEFKYAFAIPAGGTLTKNLVFSWTVPLQDTDAVPATNANIGVGIWRLYFRCIYVGGGNAGNVQFEWAQQNAIVGDTMVMENSFIIAHRLG